MEKVYLAFACNVHIDLALRCQGTCFSKSARENLEKGPVWDGRLTQEVSNTIKKGNHVRDAILCRAGQSYLSSLGHWQSCRKQL